MMTIRKDLGSAKTEDGFVFYRQPDGSYTDGDLYFADERDLELNSPGVLLAFHAPDGSEESYGFPEERCAICDKSVTDTDADWTVQWSSPDSAIHVAMTCGDECSDSFDARYRDEHRIARRNDRPTEF